MARGAGRPSAASLEAEKLERICDRHADGEPLAKVCADEGMTQTEFRRRIRRDPALGMAWEEARKEYVHSLFNELAELTKRLSTSKFGRDSNAEVSALRAAIDGLKHITGRLNPGAYGEQKAGTQGITVIINTDLPIRDGDKPGETIEGDFKVEVPLERLQ